MTRYYAIGVDLGGTNLRAALISSDGHVHEKIKVPTSDDPLGNLQKAIEELKGKKKIVGVGLGVAGLIDRENGIVLKSPNLPMLDGGSLKDIGIRPPLFIENDANCAALGEKWMGAGREFQNFVLLTLGTGIGGGMIYKGHLLEVAAEVGHMSIVSGGEKCPCGNNGCLENYASARAIRDAAIKAVEKGAKSALNDCCNGNIYKVTPESIYRTAFDGDGIAREIIKEAGRYLGVGISNLINVMSPEAVILSGGLVGAWDLFVEEAIREASRRAFRGLFEKVRILPAALGDDAGVVGAAALVFNECKSA